MATYKRGKSGGETTHEWRSVRQRDLVLERLKKAGIKVDTNTPPQVCWSLLTDLMLSELKGGGA